MLCARANGWKEGEDYVCGSRNISNVDTLHKKNLFLLGEVRFLTTLLMKHFPTFKTKFCPDAVAHTMTTESWRILFSQRRRWINSTVHNLFASRRFFRTFVVFP